MSEQNSKEIRSKVTSDGYIELSIVKIDRVSGGLASEESSDPIFEYFLEENLPN